MKGRDSEHGAAALLSQTCLPNEIVCPACLLALLLLLALPSCPHVLLVSLLIDASLHVSLCLHLGVPLTIGIVFGEHAGCFVYL